MTTISATTLHKNATRQAKRLKTRLAIPLTSAKEILAKGPYRCASWIDLSSRLELRRDEHAVLLASLPISDVARSYFLKHIEKISRSLSQYILTNANLTGLYETARFVFGFPAEPVLLSDVTQSLQISAWKSLSISPDPDAVIYSRTIVNNVPMMLIGTRVYMPKYLQFGDEVVSSSSYAEPYSGIYRIMWSSPETWYKAAYDYLSWDPDEEEGEDFLECPDLVLPEETLNSAMQHHENWFSRIAECWHMESSYGDHGEDFLPYVIPERGCYLLFGIPVNLAPNSSTDNSVFQMTNDTGGNDSTLALIDDQPVCLEWISVNQGTKTHTGQYENYFQSLLNGILSHDECDLSLYRSNGWDKGYFFIRPSTQSEIHHHLKVEFHPEKDGVAFVLKSDQPSIASKIFDDVASRNITVHHSHHEEQRYIIELDVSEYEGISSVSLSLDTITHESWSGHNLISCSLVEHDAAKKTLYVTVSSTLLSLSDVLPKQSLKDATRFGLVLHQPKSFLDMLKQAPKRCQNLRQASQELADLFTKPLSDSDLSPFDLFRHMKRIKYKRDNF
jgi:hypothetical protein